MTTPPDKNCPECGRPQAESAADIISGACPKWYAVRDQEAKEDCERVAAFATSAIERRAIDRVRDFGERPLGGTQSAVDAALRGWSELATDLAHEVDILREQAARHRQATNAHICGECKWEGEHAPECPRGAFPSHEQPREQAIHEKDCPTAWAFFNKHGLGSKLPPSCLVCGKPQPDRDEWGIWHMELPNVMACKACVNAARGTVSSTAPRNDVNAEAIAVLTQRAGGELFIPNGPDIEIGTTYAKVEEDGVRFMFRPLEAQ
jgi:ribosomal protein L37AE/L43A